MKSVYDKTTRDELINRIHSLNESNKAQWGKMTIYQMFKHCSLWEEMVFGRQKCKRVFIGRLIGKMVLKGMIKDERPLTRNTPSATEHIVKGNGDPAAERTRWIALIEEYTRFSNPDFVHPFFGKMTKEQIGYLAYKHADHHLRQFNG
jgi:hypothetical protein